VKPKFRKYAQEPRPGEAVARMRGLRILFEEGKTAEQLWLYAETGDWQRRETDSPYMRGDQIQSLDDFQEQFPQGATPEVVLTFCMNRMRKVSLENELH